MSNRYRWYVIVILTIAATLNYADRAAISALLPLMRSGLGMSAAMLGGLNSFFMVSYALTSPLTGLLGYIHKPTKVVGLDLFASGGGLFTMGYQGDYGDQISSDHGLTLGFNGDFNGYYYNPKFLSFSATPYWGQSRADSSSQSLTSSKGVDGIANFFTGSHFPGSVDYSTAYNSTGNYGIPGISSLDTTGNNQNFGINWGAYVPGLPTLSVGYQMGDSNYHLNGTNEDGSSRFRTEFPGSRALTWA